jgi:NADPH2:quinone reductase
MKAIQLNEQQGPESLKLVEVPRPVPVAGEVLIEVRAAGVNYADYELSRGRYPLPRPLPIIMGFEAAGVVVEVSSRVKTLRVGDRVATVVSSGGYAQFATANASFAIPIPDGVSFADAITIPIQGLSAYALLKIAAKPQPHETLLIQAAAGGVGLYLVQLAKIMGFKQVVALASSQEKLDLVKSLGADVAINYSNKNWPDQVRQVTSGKGVDVVLEMASGEVGDESFKLIAPFGRIIFFGVQNYHDFVSTEKMRQLIFKNLSAIGFAFPTLRPDQIAECVPALLNLIVRKKVKIFSNTSFRLAEARAAFAALSGRQNIGKIVLVP